MFGESKMEQDKKCRNRTIDFIKGLCIVFVIVTHLDWEDSERLKYLFPYWIDMAVPIFMIISGYVYAKSLERKNMDSLSKAYNVHNIVKNIIRYTIPYFFIILFEIFAVGVGDSSDVIQFFIRGGTGPGSYYYPIMIQFIFVFPVIYYMVKKYDFYGVCLCVIFNAIYELLKTSYMMEDACYRVLIFRYIFIISCGCYLAIKKRKIRTEWKIIVFISGFIFITMCRYGNYVPYTITKWIGTSWLASMYVVPLIFWVIRKDKLKCRIIEIIGKASYNIYLVQMVYFVKHAGVIYAIFERREYSYFCNVCMCVIFGVCFYYIEKPLTKKIINCLDLVLNLIKVDKIKKNVDRLIYK